MGVRPGSRRVFALRRVPLKVIGLIALFSAGIIPPFVFLIYSSLHQLDSSGAFGALTARRTSRRFSTTERWRRR